ncbi:1-acyl-sn-glycerol-3-phosphate acyltransferase [bacterium]|nr:1-acyl-sn-glycerol-3-phosphate acyltransferase [bacterium]
MNQARAHHPTGQKLKHPPEVLKRVRRTGDYARRRQPKYGVYPNFYTFAHRLVELVFRRTCRWDVYGLDNLPMASVPHISAFGHEYVERLPLPVVFAVKHVSIRDIFVVGLSIRRVVGWMVKSPLGQIYGFSRVLIWLSGVFVFRDKDIDQIATGKQFRYGLLGDDALPHLHLMLDDGYSVMVFAEGTRDDPLAVKDIKTGPLRLAINANVKIVPVGLAGTGKRKNGALVKRRFLRRRCVAVFGGPIDPTDFSMTPARNPWDAINLPALRSHVRERMELCTHEAHQKLLAL